MKKSNKFLNFYIIFVIILTSLAVVLFLNVPSQIVKHIEKHPEPVQNSEQPKDETANWLTYENKKYGYKVKYPRDWNFEELDKNRKVKIEKTLPEINSMGGHDFGSIFIEVLNDIDDDLLEQWVEQNYPIDVSQELKFKKEITIDNQKGIYREITNSVSGGYQNDAFVIIDDKIYKININIYIANNKIQDEYKEILESIMNSLEFTSFKNKRILLTPENISQYNPPSSPKCSEKFNQDPSNTTVDYYNKEKGISFEVPYNSNWGNEKYKINPYEKWNNESGKEYILFGSITNFEACSWVRTYALYFSPIKSAENIIKDAKKYIDPELFIVKPTKKSINGLDVVESQSHGLCDSGELEVVGKKYNYVFRSLCGADFEFLENIVKSIELIN